MDKNKAKELSDILLAYSQGKTIQYFADGSDFNKGEWVDVNNLNSGILKEASMEVNGEYLELRIKPEPKLVPFTFDDNLVGKVVVTKDNNNKALIVGQMQDGVYTGTRKSIIRYNELLKLVEFEDGSPCGKYIEE